jgi:hypothetical protein
MNEHVRRRLDAIAHQDEHSHVDRSTRKRIGRAILEHEAPEPTLHTARRIVTALSADGLAQRVADWLDARDAI